MKYGFRSLAVLLLAVSCAHPTSVRPSLIPLKGSITFPKDGAVFLEGTQVTFRCDAPSSEVRWFQSDLPLTSGLSCTLKMTAGSKTYRILADGQLLDEVNIKVLPLGQQSKLVFTLSGPQGVVSLPSGEFLPYIGSFSETRNNYSLGWTSLATAPLIVTNHLSRSDPLPPRPAWFPRVSVPEGLHDAKSRSIMSSRQFHFPNLGGIGASPDLETRLFAEDEHFQLYSDVHDNIRSTELQWLWEQLAERYLPRTEALWGPPGRASGSGKISLVVTGRLNADGRVIGFFNPADLFPKNLDPASPDYNPGSNEGKVLYMGVPDESQANYTRASIAATAAHEYQHLIHFSRKTLAQARLGNFDRFREAVFLDEGFSHLTESLVGLGASGGNLLFCNYYLKHTSDVSLLFPDRAGTADNVGIRGGICLYLDWLFAEHGGGRWDPNNPKVFQDGGGIAYLRKLIDSPWKGVENIEQLVGKPFSDSLQDWADWMNTRAIEGDVEVDPWTGEPNRASPFLGNVDVPGAATLSLNGPSRLPFGQAIGILPYSLVFLSPIHMTSADSLTYTGSSSVGPIFLNLFPKGQ